MAGQAINFAEVPRLGINEDRSEVVSDCDYAILRGTFTRTVDSALCIIFTDSTAVACNTTKATTVDAWDCQSCCYGVTEDSF